MKIEINSNIDWTPIALFVAILLFFTIMFYGINYETQLKQQTMQKAIERGWTIEQVQKLR
jgi:hypothetical protein